MTQTIKCVWPMRESDLVFFHAKVIREFDVRQRDEEWRARAQDAQLLEKVPTFRRDQRFWSARRKRRNI